MLLAHEVLNDCRIVHQMLEDEEDVERMRALWAGGIALLRAVGHILEKVDGADPVVGEIIAERYRDWKSNRKKYAVFWEFIEQERNNILKTYQFSSSFQDKIPLVVPVPIQNPETGKMDLTHELYELDGDLYCPIEYGFGTNEDIRDVYLEAVEWWY